MFKEISEYQRPVLAGTSILKGVGGSLIHVYRDGICKLELGPVKLTRKLLVADIEDDVLLRKDILMDERDGRVDILLSKGVMQLQRHCIPCVTATEKNVGCIMRSADEFIFPPMSGAIIPASIERIANTSRQNKNLLLEPFRNFFVKIHHCYWRQH